ncbi:ABC transporter ATP-binding protein [Halovivax limisalsi]|uniref:ABC transporter ATP-binding protein n=1 Tax=Halovivax limisalsi TaxID=1453760 RepID=UPI001FFD83F2|nr:ABC transporter ATP-binding protein [Halovivax limisalsi]
MARRPIEGTEDVPFAIETHGLGKDYGAGEDRVTAVAGLDLTVERGEVFGLLGPNGAGKSTTIDVLLGLARPTAGRASVLGHDAETERQAIRERIGVLPEGLGLYDRLTGRRHLELAIEWADATDDPDALLERVGLADADAARPAAEYSTGMAQRLALAMALIGEPDLLVLDEPSSGLDPHGIKRLRSIIREEAERGATVVFSSHVLGQVEAVCDRVAILADGELVAVDPIDDLRRAVGRGSELRLRIPEAPSIDVDGMEGVAATRYADGTLIVETSEPAAKADVVTRLAATDVPILDIDASDPSLEAVFTAYTRGTAGAADRPFHEPERAPSAEARRDEPAGHPEVAGE